MIIFVDPDDYDKKLANKKNPPPQVRPGTQLGRTRRGIRTDGMKTVTGFYPRERGPKNKEMDEDVEVIKVEKKSDDESDLVSE